MASKIYQEPRKPEFAWLLFFLFERAGDQRKEAKESRVAKHRIVSSQYFVILDFIWISSIGINSLVDSCITKTPLGRKYRVVYQLPATVLFIYLLSRLERYSGIVPIGYLEFISRTYPS